jgi:hypothetical protein
MPQDTTKLLDMIIELRLDLSEYREKLPKWIWQNFFIQCREKCHKENQDCAAHLVDEIIEWENGKQYGSLEAMLNKKFKITEVLF